MPPRETKKTKIYIYALYDGFEDNVFYVGATRDIESRHKAHVSRHRRLRKENHNHTVKSDPKILILEEIKTNYGLYAEYQKVEDKWMKEMIERGKKLINIKNPLIIPKHKSHTYTSVSVETIRFEKLVKLFGTMSKALESIEIPA